ncbi:MAG TPA: hypothetical protein PK073_04565 [Ignavibacteriaceae bacterium]|jgi:hypothetical protein|nr:MAG: hypothetical protein BWY38_01436 [Ignavibacteria bacterium ADurb.Bin266]OQY74365.1 MAG: hypothetical protein B6D44_04350 [Ignavibacteriales bacterium UTCHB2]HQF42167.1 hypothetical protein [Ignavibacteriaceae bacterium]HQI40926.1 hypothetical protein [Ignavibacteriaceae bacterium]
MFRIIISIVLIIFLFGGIIGTATQYLKPKPPSNIIITADMYIKKDSRLSIKEIEKLTAEENYIFTYSNSLK